VSEVEREGRLVGGIVDETGALCLLFFTTELGAGSGRDERIELLEILGNLEIPAPNPGGNGRLYKKAIWHS